jgi:YesN/AraC family two-component response regulator
MQKSDIEIVVVDDEEEILEVISQFLDLYCVKTFTDGRDAIDYVITSNQVQLIISDIKMPKIDGIELLKKIHVEKPEIPFIILTAYSSIDIAINALKIGASDFLFKPFDRDDLLGSVKKVLKKKDKEVRYKEAYTYINKQDFEIVIPSKNFDVSVISTFITNQIFFTNMFNPDDSFNFRSAIYEGLTNAHEHGNLELNSHLKHSEYSGVDAFQEMMNKRLDNKKYSDRKISIHLHLDSEKVSVTIEDEGSGFDTNKITDIDPLALLEVEKNHGRGYFMMQLYSDEVLYNEKGNQVTLIKYKDRQ